MTHGDTSVFRCVFLGKYQRGCMESNTKHFSVVDVGVKGVWGSKVHQIDFQPACIGGWWFVFW